MNQQSPEYQLSNRLNNTCVKFNLYIYIYIYIYMQIKNTLGVKKVQGQSEAAV